MEIRCSEDKLPQAKFKSYREKKAEYVARAFAASGIRYSRRLNNGFPGQRLKKANCYKHQTTTFKMVGRGKVVERC